MQKARTPRDDGLVLNFAPVLFDDADVTVGVLPYGTDGDDTLKQLRRAHNGTHVFRRDGPDAIVAVPVALGATSIGEPKRIRLKENLGLAAALIRNALLNYLAGLGRTVLSYEPMQYISNRDLLRACCPSGVTPPDWLAVRILYELAIRPIYFLGKEHFVAAVLDVRTTRIIDRTAAEFICNGFRLDDVYVGRFVPSHDTRIAPEFELLGCVQSVDGEHLRLTDSRDGIEAVNASEVWPWKNLFPACLSHVFGDRAAEVTDALECERAALRRGPARLERIRTILDFLGSRCLEMVPETTFKFGPLIDESMSSFPTLEAAPKPVYIYDETGSRRDTWHDNGLNRYGPYSARVETMAAPRICVIAQRSRRVEVDRFLRKFFFDGVTVSPSRGGKARKNYFDKGFCKKYSLDDPVQYEFFLAEDPSAESYAKACREALEKGDASYWSLAFVQIDEAFHHLPPAANPYYLVKAAFQTHQILVQEFEIETTRYWGSPLSFCLNNMSLATYAKLGGIPWLMESPCADAHELVFGLGCTDVGQGRLAKRERFVGITTVFGGDGYYHLSSLSRAVTKDEYRDELLKALRGAVSNVTTGMNCRPGDRILLVFHSMFKHFSDEEVQAVAELITEFGEYDVRYAFVQMSEKHPYILFDTSQEGVQDYETKRTKGQYAPVRGRYLQLGDREALLSLTGPREVKRPEDGTPKPLLLSLHRDSTFDDMKYITEQTFAFACNSWRTFLPVSRPVTIQYADLIAKSLGNLSRLDRWDPYVMLGSIGRALWFL